MTEETLSLVAMQGIAHRYLTECYYGIGGRIKSELDDFQVTEVPLYQPSDHGEHSYFEIEKRDFSTLEAVERIAFALGVRSSEIGYAGLKDRKGVTRQVLSVRLVDPKRVRELKLAQIRVLWVRLHTNKLRIGHLRGNRFKIRVRDVLRASHRQIEKIVDTILDRGLPNYFGPQRFGRRGNSFRIGRALLLRDYEEVVRRIVGYPSRYENNPRVVAARFKFMGGDIPGALTSFPSSYRAERRILRYLARAEGNYRGAVRKLTHEVKRIYYSSFQSYLFNRILDHRLRLSGGRLDTLYKGDLAFLHRNQAVFNVVDPVAEQSRAAGFEISPSGPLFGKMMPWPEGIEGHIERDTVERLALRASNFHQLMPSLHMKGARRPFRVKVSELLWELQGCDLVLEFFLPKGTYATTFLREILKNDDPPFAYYTAAPEDVPVPEGLDDDEDLEGEPGES